MTYTIRDLEDRYGVREHTVLHWIQSGQLKALNVGVDPGKKKPRWRVTDAALEAFELARSTTPPATKVRRRRQQAEIVEFIK